MNKLKLYRQMKSELLARKAPLLREKDLLLKAATRLTEIGSTLAMIDEEIAEYDAAIEPLLETSIDDPEGDKKLADATPADAVVTQ